MQWIDYLQFEKCELEMVKFLLDKGLDCTKTALPSSALFWCCMKNHGELVKLLYDNGARFMKVNSKGEQISEAVLLVA